MSIKIYTKIFYATSFIYIGIINTSDAFCRNIEQITSENNIYYTTWNLDSIKNNTQDTAIIKISKNDHIINEYHSDNDLKNEIEQNRKKRNKIKNLELIYQTLNAIDAIQTISCMQKINCEEKNPLFGKHPSVAKIIAIKSLSGILHYSAYRHGIKRDDRLKYTMAMELITIGVQGIVVGLNFRSAF